MSDLRHTFKHLNCKLRIAFACAFTLVAGSNASAAIFTLDDVEFWVGAGENRAAMVVDWVDDSQELPALAWGYRWDGTATGHDMLLAIVAADSRLFAKLGDFSGVPSLFGFGYDADADGQFGILKIDLGGEPIETDFDELGIAYSEIPDEDRRTASATDANDYYAEGWFTGFWHYGTASANPYDGGSWNGVPSPMASRPLTDGAWDSWVFTPTFDFTAFAENPMAAPAPGVLLFGDYNENDVIDAADYTVWRDAMTAASGSLPNDPTPGTVDESDFLYWRSHFGQTLGAGASANAQSVPGEPQGPNNAAVPEPSTWQLMLISVWTLWTTLFRRRKEND
jgi:PEP-CTERM motif